AARRRPRACPRRAAREDGASETARRQDHSTQHRFSRSTHQGPKRDRGAEPARQDARTHPDRIERKGARELPPPPLLRAGRRGALREELMTPLEQRAAHPAQGPLPKFRVIAGAEPHPGPEPVENADSRGPDAARVEREASGRDSVRLLTKAWSASRCSSET